MSVITTFISAANEIVGKPYTLQAGAQLSEYSATLWALRAICISLLIDRGLTVEQIAQKWEYATTDVQDDYAIAETFDLPALIKTTLPPREFFLYALSQPDPEITLDYLSGRWKRDPTIDLETILKGRQREEEELILLLPPDIRTNYEQLQPLSQTVSRAIEEKVRKG